MKSDELIEQLLSEDPILLTRGRRMLRNPVMRAAAQGRLTRLLPGVDVDAGRAADLEVRAAAVARWDPSAVICGRAAAGLTYWPEVKVTSIEVASPVRHARNRGSSSPSAGSRPTSSTSLARASGPRHRR